MAKIKKMTKVTHCEVEENATYVKIDAFCQRLGLEVLYKGDRETLYISTLNINRPGLQLAGYYEHFGHERVEVFGEQEMAYLRSMSR